MNLIAVMLIAFELPKNEIGFTKLMLLLLLLLYTLLLLVLLLLHIGFNFTLNNPCILDESIKATDLEKRAIWACNAEQRILKGIIDNLDLEPTAITISPHAHTSEEGIHYYIWRHAWRSLLEWPDQYFEDERAFAISMLNQTIIGCLNILFPEDREFLLAKSDVLRDLYSGVSLLESYV